MIGTLWAAAQLAYSRALVEALDSGSCTALLRGCWTADSSAVRVVTRDVRGGRHWHHGLTIPPCKRSVKAPRSGPPAPLDRAGIRELWSDPQPSRHEDTTWRILGCRPPRTAF